VRQVPQTPFLACFLSKYLSERCIQHIMKFFVISGELTAMRTNICPDHTATLTTQNLPGIKMKVMPMWITNLDLKL